MRSEVKRWFKIVFCTLMVVFSVSIGFSDWVYPDNSGDKTSGNGQATLNENENVPVAYTKVNGSNRLFVSLADAIDATSSGNIYVIPGTNPILTRNCEIKAGVILNLPYEDDLKDNHVVEDPGRTSTGDFADHVEYSTRNNQNPTVFCQNNVTIADGVTLTNNGSIFVGGVLGRNGQAPTGMTVGKYTKITLGSNSSIANAGTITCYGFIKEKNGVLQPGKVISSGNGVLNLPVVIYDFRGGSFSSYAVGALRLSSWKAMPFNVFDFPNVQCDVYFTENSVLNGTITVYANDDVMTSSALLIGPSNSTSLIRLTSGNIKYRYTAPLGYLYDDYNQGTTEAKVNKTSFLVNGDVNIASMKINAGIDINTSEFHLPFSYKFSFEFQSGTINIANKIKFLAGSVFVIDKDANVNINAEMVFYQNYIPVITTGRGDGYPRFSKSANLINNGTLSIKAKFGGIVQSSSESAKTLTSGGYSGSINTNEALTGETGGLKGTNEEHSESAKITLIDKRVFDPNSDNQMLYSFGRTESELNSDAVMGDKTYISHEMHGWNRYGWYAGDAINNLTYGIRYSLNSETASNPNSGNNSFNTLSGNVFIKPLDNTNQNLLFEGYYYDSNYTISSLLGKSPSGDYILNPSIAKTYVGNKNHVILYGKWTDKSKAVTIQFRKYDANGNLVNGESYPASIGDSCNISEFTSSFNDTARAEKVLENAKISYDFTKWVVRNASGNEVNITNNVFTPEEGNSVYYVDPVYSETNWLKYIFVNDKVSYVVATYYAITKFTIDGNDYTHKDQSEHEGYVKADNVVYIEKDTGRSKKYTVSITFGDGKTINLDNKTENYTLKLSDYKFLFDNLNGPIRIQGKIS